jgi:hypothetical protein
MKRREMMKLASLAIKLAMMPGVAQAKIGANARVR